MSKNIIRGTVAIVILFIVFSVLCIAIPFEHTMSYWLAFVFGGIAILVQLPLLYLAFCRGNTPKSRFYGFPYCTGRCFLYDYTGGIEFVNNAI